MAFSTFPFQTLYFQTYPSEKSGTKKLGSGQILISQIFFYCEDNNMFVDFCRTILWKPPQKCCKHFRENTKWELSWIPYKEGGGHAFQMRLDEDAVNQKHIRRVAGRYKAFAWLFCSSFLRRLNCVWQFFAGLFLRNRTCIYFKLTVAYIQLLNRNEH